MAQYLLQSLSAVKQWVRHYKDEGIDGLKESNAVVAPVRLAIRIIPNYFNLYLQCRIIKMVAVRLKDIQNMLAKDFNIHYQNITAFIIY
ncbi:hypothetical protein BSPWISOXPB_6527 [uncultured Gammaproteobacteria bacterium]|nr:hypothetical protein BSPWISOXPB_6527 [uncultured Gammaproteobacteria bacterium]